MSTPMAAIALSELSSPPLRPLRIFQLATVKVPLPSVRDGGSCSLTMGSATRTPAVIPRSQALQPPRASAKRLVDQLHLPGLPGGGRGKQSGILYRMGGIAVTTADVRTRLRYGRENAWCLVTLIMTIDE